MPAASGLPDSAVSRAALAAARISRVYGSVAKASSIRRDQTRKRTWRGICQLIRMVDGYSILVGSFTPSGTPSAVRAIWSTVVLTMGVLVFLSFAGPALHVAAKARPGRGRPMLPRPIAVLVISPARQ